MKQVTFLDTLAGTDFVFVAGKTYDLEDAKAAKWIRAGFCRLADKPKPKPETASAPPKGESADASPQSK